MKNIYITFFLKSFRIKHKIGVNFTWMKETKRVWNWFWNFLKGFVDMIGENFQIYKNLLPVEETAGTFQPFSAELKIKND